MSQKTLPARASDTAMTWVAAFDMGAAMLAATDVEPTSAFREAGAQCGIAWGDPMGEFVRWALAEWCRS